MVDAAVGGIGLFKRLRGRTRAGVSEVDGFWHHEIPVAAEIGVDLFGGNEEEVFVGEAACALKVDLLLEEPFGAWVAGIGVVVEVSEVDDVDAEAAEDGDPAGMVVEGLEVAQLLVEIHVEVAADNFKPGDWFEDV